MLSVEFEIASTDIRGELTLDRPNQALRYALGVTDVDLAIHKTDDSCYTLPGGTNTYTITVTNVDNFGDVLAVIAAWGPCQGCPEDINQDGEVSFADILVVIGAWGPC